VNSTVVDARSLPGHHRDGMAPTRSHATRAIAAAIAISATLGMSATRSAIAAGTWLVIHIVLAMTLGKLMRL